MMNRAEQLAELQDAFGTTVHIGDEVVFIRKWAGTQMQLAKAKVFALKVSGGKKCFVMRDYSIEGYDYYDFACWPQNVMKV